jgi:serine/threonine protein kinase
MHVVILFRPFLKFLSTMHEDLQLAMLNLSATKLLIARMSQEKVPIELLCYDFSKTASSSSESKNFEHLRGLSKFDKYMVPPEVYQAFKSNESGPIAGDKVDIFQIGVLMFIARYKRQPFVEASMVDPIYRLIMEGKFKNASRELLRSCYNPEEDDAFLSLLLQILHPNPKERPSLKDILAQPLWNLDSKDFSY